MCGAKAHVRFTPESGHKRVRLSPLLAYLLPPIIAVIGGNKCPHEELAWLVLIHDCERHVDLMLVAGP